MPGWMLLVCLPARVIRRALGGNPPPAWSWRRSFETASGLLLRAEPTQLCAGFWREWPRARAISDRGLTVAPQDVILLGDRVLLEYEFGEWERGESYLERFVETMRGAPSPE